MRRRRLTLGARAAFALTAFALTALALAAPGPARADDGRPAVARVAHRLAAAVARARGQGVEGGTVALAFAAAGGPDDAVAGGDLGRLEARLLAADLRHDAGFLHVVRVDGDHAHALDAALHAGADTLLEVTLHLTSGTLLLTGTLTPTWRNFWTGELSGRPRAVAARVPADDAARLLARSAEASEPLPGLLLRPLLQVPGRALAVAAGDATGDGTEVIAVLTDRALSLVDLGPRGPSVLATHGLGGRRPADAVARDPAGGVVVAPIALAPAVAYGDTGHLEGEVLTFDGHALTHLARLPQVPLAAGGGAILYGTPVPGAGTFARELRLVRAQGPAVHLDARAEVVSAAVGPGGEAVAVVDATWHLEWLAGPEARAARRDASGGALPDAPVGAGLALADLDGDGTPERVGTAAGPPGARDQLVIATPGGRIRARRTVPGTIRALAAGDLGPGGRPAVVVASWDGKATWLYLLTGPGADAGGGTP